MKHLSTPLLLLLAAPTIALAQQPFAHLGVEVKVLTLTAGRYPEFFAHDSLRRIGSVVYDTRRQRIAALLPTDSVAARIGNDVPTRWLSVDPLAHKFADESPYTYVSNSPINKIDPDGRSGIATLDKQSHTVTISSTMIFYGNVATPALAKTTAATIERMWNAANGTVVIGGETYKVRFNIKGIRTADTPFLRTLTIPLNRSLQDNYIRIDEQNDGNASKTDKIGANTGYWTLEQQRESGGTTGAHEYGHGVGAQHTNLKRATSLLPPDIMITEVDWTLVPADYILHIPNSVVNTKLRKVMQKDVTQIFTPDVVRQLQQKGVAGVGELTNEYHANQDSDVAKKDGQK